MTEPTIDEMLAWLDNPHVPKPYSFFDAIRAILEQHRYFNRAELHKTRSRYELKAIRAFVERVKRRHQEILAISGEKPSTQVDAYLFETLDSVLDAMEKESA